MPLPKLTFTLDPLTRKKLNRFRSIRRGYVSFLILTEVSQMPERLL